MTATRIAHLPGLMPLAVLAVTLLLWQSGALMLRADFLPTVGLTWDALTTLGGESDTARMVYNSLRTMFAGFGLAFLVTVPLGLAMGRCDWLREMIQPTLTLFYPMPKAALMPIFMLWFGLGDTSKIVVIYLGASLPLLYHSYQGAASVDEKLLWQASAFGMSPLRRLFKVVLPMSLPDVFLGCRVAMSMALIVMVSSEMIVRQDGIGGLMFNALDLAQYDYVYAAIVIVALIGALLDIALEALRRRVVFWVPGDVLEGGR
jgi:ABC-type nitrate/sulfonate/bicarbonate transport system permease component